MLRGSVQIEERQVYHQEGAKGVEASQMRVTQCLAGKGFHHYPLVMNNLFYGYSARVVDPIGARAGTSSHMGCAVPAEPSTESASYRTLAGASVILLTKQDYVHALRKQMEKEMMDTVNILKGTPFFSAWSEMSISRLCARPRSLHTFAFSVPRAYLADVTSLRSQTFGLTAVGFRRRRMSWRKETTR